MSQNVDWATYNISATPRVIGYYQGKAVYRQAISGVMSTNDNTELIIPAKKILNYSIFCKSGYGQWWSVPNLHSEAVYTVYLYITYSGSNATLHFSCGSAMRDQPYEGYVDYCLD